MNRVVSFCAIAAMLVGCAGQSRQSAIEKSAPIAHPRVEIVYNAKTQLAVLDTGATPTAGLGGLFGPLGVLVTIGIDAASRHNSLNQAESRSQRFQQAVQDSTGDLVLNQEYAERLADAMRATGREVKLTPSDRATGPTRKMELAGLSATPGYEVLLVRITAGYGAASLTSSFRPIAIVEYALHDEKQQPVVWKYISSIQGNGPTYFSYDTLLKEHKAAFDGLRAELFSTVEQVMRQDFAIRK